MVVHAPLGLLAYPKRMYMPAPAPAPAPARAPAPAPAPAPVCIGVPVRALLGRRHVDAGRADARHRRRGQGDRGARARLSDPQALAHGGVRRCDGDPASASHLRLAEAGGRCCACDGAPRRSARCAYVGRARVRARARNAGGDDGAGGCAFTGAARAVRGGSAAGTVGAARAEASQREAGEGGRA
eukprot:2510101-Pleurochrysis_carterae.AAC.1